MARRLRGLCSEVSAWQSCAVGEGAQGEKGERAWDATRRRRAGERWERERGDAATRAPSGAHPLDGGDGDGAVEEPIAKRQPAPHVVVHQAALDAALRRDVEHRQRDIRANPKVAGLLQDFAGESGAAADVEEEARRAVGRQAQHLERALRHRPLHGDHSRVVQILARLRLAVEDIRRRGQLRPAHRRTRGGLGEPRGGLGARPADGRTGPGARGRAEGGRARMGGHGVGRHGERTAARASALPRSYSPRSRCRALQRTTSSTPRSAPPIS